MDADLLSRLHEPPEEYEEEIVDVQHVASVMSTMDDFGSYVNVEELDEDGLIEVNELQTPFDWKKLQDLDQDLHKVKIIVACGDKVPPKEYPRRYRKLSQLRDMTFIGEDGILYKRATIEGLVYNLIVIPTATLPRVLEALHDESGHFGVERIISFFQSRFYMSGYTKAISDYVNSCVPCNKKKDLPRKKGKMGRVTADRPWQVVSMDYLKLEQDAAGYHNILVVTDVFTKYAFAFPTRNETALTTAKVLVEKVFGVFGIPERLLSDNGKCFESEVIKQLCVLFRSQEDIYMSIFSSK